MANEVQGKQGVWLLLYAKKPPDGSITITINGIEMQAAPVGHNHDQRGLQPYWVELPEGTNPYKPLSIKCTVAFSRPKQYVRLSKEALKAFKEQL